MWRDPGTPADSYYQLRPECSDVPESKFRIKAGKTLSSRKWKASFSPEGYLDIGKTLRRIQRGGIHPSIRGEVWEFLLGCYDPKSTFEERDQIRQRRRVSYAHLKEECHQMFPLVGRGKFVTAPIITEDGEPTQDPIVLQQINLEKEPAALTVGNGNDENPDASGGSQMEKQSNGHGAMDKREIQWKLTLHQIGLDVVRTDRTLVFYEKQENLSKLWISWLSMPGLMQMLATAKRGNFRCTERSVGVEAQLGNLASVTQVVDPKLHQHLGCFQHITLNYTLSPSLNSRRGDYLFAIRMLMVLFRREFSFPDSLYLWEMMWALEYDPDLFSMYEEHESAEKSEGPSRGKAKSKRHCGKFERENLKNGRKNASAPLPISVFLWPVS
ncbi:UNVERIFIED_CONTAM: GTPase-activating protein gyp7 [Sesamum angustifolium]|uniref:GTPase-activating protein gyp7 n=1 Tax=Sesamum angustifolium TaxID=2727405 RepID=A0AAW2PF53_9LAMI